MFANLPSFATFQHMGVRDGFEAVCSAPTTYGSSYVCTSRTEGRITFDYTSRTFSFACQLVVDDSGIVREYPGIGRRHG